MAHAADLAGGSIAGVEFTIHTDGDIDQVPSDSDKNVPHHHNYCHGHDVGAPARTTMEYTPVLTVPKPTISASASLDGRTGMVNLRPPPTCRPIRASVGATLSLLVRRTHGRAACREREGKDGKRP